MTNELAGGMVCTVAELQAEEYLPNKGVFFAQIVGKPRHDGMGFYLGTIEPGAEIASEVHPETSETVYILAGEAVGLVGDREVPLRRGQAMHVQKNVPHGLRNAGSAPLEFLVIGCPDF